MASLAALAAGCTGLWNGQKEALTVAEEHPISVDTQVVTLTVDLDRATSELSPLDKSRLRALADAYLTSGHGPLTITAPSGSSDELNGEKTAAEIRKYLNEAGVDWSALAGSTYRAADDRGRQIIVSYTHYVATPSACGNWAGIKARDYGNLRTPNFGCATQNNLAAMIADPHDLIEPAGDAPPDAQARIRGVNSYRKGEVTASETDANIKTEVAE
jgi:pilus assembly protein CpaD